MCTTFWFCFYASLISVIAYSINRNVDFPKNNCDLYFTYGNVNLGSTFIGIFTAHRTDLNEFYWEATFTAHGANVDQVDNLYPYPTEEEFYDKVRKREPAQMYVTFGNITNELPMLTGLKLNGDTLCKNQKYPPPSTTTRVARRVTADQIRTGWTFRKNN
ncbi:uncharacterized protein LOC119560489 [Drosophila subpulchrella]|uniref:uncharacterized protein LOC119560489 n=1 Tax=Drosophila subpulchrella TaxID=1486046 RepID=UPI0018A175DC|nr:uncharacterized protein LOC119560489 [Drosophila subpulchrella]